MFSSTDGQGQPQMQIKHKLCNFLFFMAYTFNCGGFYTMSVASSNGSPRSSQYTLKNNNASMELASKF